MILPKLASNRFTTEEGLRITVQVPNTHAEKVIQAVCNISPLEYGDYDNVTFKTSIGVQQFRSLGTGRNPASPGVVELDTVEISFFLPGDEQKAVQVLETVYTFHPFEEPVVFVQPCVRTLHINGVDEDNPNKVWNSEKVDWYPEEHQK
ncbi:MAG: hypothetical protein AAGD96_13590 [Chloroflexota bacterium]